MNNYKELIERLKRYGLTNGTSLGRHMGIMDEAASALTTLTEEVDKLRSELKRSQESHAFWMQEEMTVQKQLRAELESYRALGPIDHLRELVQADQDGRLVVLPCNVGDTVYMPIGRWAITGYEEDVCDGFHITNDGVLQIKARCWCGNHGTYGVAGKTVFLTREEAEAALSSSRDQNTQEDQS